MFCIQKNNKTMININKSKFFGYCFFVEKIEDCDKIIANLSHEHLESSHVCYAYIVNDNDTILYKANDDGEPSQTAGAPILAVENITDTFPIPIDFVGNSESFMLTVRGESMIEAGILNGDYILVKKQNVANNGEIVVALIEDEATVKTFYKENGYFRLQPENDTMEPIILKEVTILGKVIGLYRKL